MNTFDSLEFYVPGFPALSGKERRAIGEFVLLWSLFEAKVLSEHGSAKMIVGTSARWARNGQLTAETFDLELAYFRNRYVVDGQFSRHFDHLHFRAYDREHLVRRVLQGEDGHPKNVAAAVLIIVYRLRNNLFHGLKWSYKLVGQLDNFNHANMALVRAIELHAEAAPELWK